MNASGTFPHNHLDIINAMHYNADGSRLVTASSDHRIKVFAKVMVGDDQEWRLVDTWRGHDAEVMEVIRTQPQSRGVVRIKPDVNFEI